MGSTYLLYRIYLFSVISAAVLLFTSVFFIIMFSDLECVSRSIIDTWREVAPPSAKQRTVAATQVTYIEMPKLQELYCVA